MKIFKYSLLLSTALLGTNIACAAEKAAIVSAAKASTAEENSTNLFWCNDTATAITYGCTLTCASYCKKTGTYSSSVYYEGSEDTCVDLSSNQAEQEWHKLKKRHKQQLKEQSAKKTDS